MEQGRGLMNSITHLADAPMGGLEMNNGMQITFYWGKQVTLLFQAWETKTATQYAQTVLASLVIAMLHEWLSYFWASLLRKAMDQPVKDSASRPPHFPSVALRMFLSILFAINATTGYFLMLMAMSFNSGVFIAIILGLMFSHFVCLMRRKLSSEVGRKV